MDLILGDLALHIDKTVALIIAATPLFIVMQLPLFQKAFSKLKDKFGDKVLRSEPREEEEIER